MNEVRVDIVYLLEDLIPPTTVFSLPPSPQWSNLSWYFDYEIELIYDSSMYISHSASLLHIENYLHRKNDLNLKKNCLLKYTQGYSHSHQKRRRDGVTFLTTEYQRL